MVGVAVKVTLVPEQMVLSASLDAILTLIAGIAFTVRVELASETQVAAVASPAVTV